ncbi:hypothetical protein NCC49_003314 [Naganishia albida]|nr:hypothetical protein NCC49_003314 [Naganishia albida]
MTTASNVTYTSPPPAYAEVTPAPKYTPKKDFSKAFGDLQGRYGFDGGAPILSSKDKDAKPKSRTRTPSSSSTESTVKTSKKDFSKAFGELQGRYGYDGGAPILASKERTSSDSSTGSKKSIIASLKSLISSKDTKASDKPKTS